MKGTVLAFVCIVVLSGIAVAEKNFDYRGYYKKQEEDAKKANQPVPPRIGPNGMPIIDYRWYKNNPDKVQHDGQQPTDGAKSPQGLRPEDVFSKPVTPSNEPVKNGKAAVKKMVCKPESSDSELPPFLKVEISDNRLEVIRMVDGVEKPTVYQCQ